MSSTYNNLGLFNSGPHRFSLGAIGEYVLTDARVNPFDPGSTPIGPLELVVTVKGRLIAESEAALWALRDAIAAQLTHPPTVATLVEHSGRTWTDMAFVRFVAADRTDRGRRWSLGYTATFQRFLE